MLVFTYYTTYVPVTVIIIIIFYVVRFPGFVFIILLVAVGNLNVLYYVHLDVMHHRTNMKNARIKTAHRFLNTS